MSVGEEEKEAVDESLYAGQSKNTYNVPMAGLWGNRFGVTVRQQLLTAIGKAVECYANVHRGAGPDSNICTRLYEEARKRILRCFTLSDTDYAVVFGSSAILEAHLEQVRRYAQTQFRAAATTEDAFVILSRDLGLHMGIGALIVRKSLLPAGAPRYTGGGTVKLVSSDTSLDTVLWAGIPEKFEPGTPHIIGAITLAKALCLLKSNFRSEELFSAAFFSPEKFTLAATALWGHLPLVSLEDILDKDELAGLSGDRLLAALPSFFIGKDSCVPTDGGAGKKIKFDNCASTPALAPVWNAFTRSLFLPAERHPEVVERARSKCREFFHASPDGYDVVFTQNATEGLNHIARILTAGRAPGDTVVINTVLEHNSNELPWRMPGITLIPLDVDIEGFIDIADLERVLRGCAAGKNVIVSIAGASNVLGSINDLARISMVAHRCGAKVIVDGAQLSAHRSINVDALGVDALVFTGHKMYAPFGSGGVVVKKELLPGEETPVMRIMRRSGEMNVAGLAALSAAFDLLQRVNTDRIAIEERILTFYALKKLRALKGVSLYGIADASSPRADFKGSVITFDVKGMLAPQVGKRLAEKAGIETRTGWFCAHRLRKKLSAIMPEQEHDLYQALVNSPETACRLMPGSVRISFGIQNTLSEVDTLVNTLADIINNEIPSAETGAPADVSYADRSFTTGKRMQDFTENMVAAVYGNPL